MKTYIRRREKNRELVVMFGGWGTDENVFIPLCNDEFDFILFYNYSADQALVLPEAKIYEKITLIGWSLGIWAAQFLSERTGFRPDVKIAVNGTPLPVDEKFGISPHVIEGTLNNLNDKNIKKFYLRMFGDRKTFMQHLAMLPQRTAKSLQDELRWLYNRIMENSDEGYNWDYAVISENDRVFPVKSQKLYWKNRPETKTILLPMNHYLFDNWQNFIDFIRFVENWNYPLKKGKIRRL